MLNNYFPAYQHHYFYRSAQPYNTQIPYIHTTFLFFNNTHNQTFLVNTYFYKYTNKFKVVVLKYLVGTNNLIETREIVWKYICMRKIGIV